MNEDGCDADAAKQRHRRSEISEFCHRSFDVISAARELAETLPDPDLPLRWASWVDGAIDSVGLPPGHRSRYRRQREQAAAVLADTTTTFFAICEQVNELGIKALQLGASVAVDSPELRQLVYIGHEGTLSHPDSYASPPPLEAARRVRPGEE
eukprot:TRINITY_DN28842_c0_g1_i3.p1 TRINITY_DN28842_c0_g1~~TRINITY_DN28842_c0_g1_i3.p1  ORF type:complete len:153 (-),score=28.27 TRINITY_DN28842_c0_g1_i3:269-727(-)